jgi:hypothetical protein
MMGTSPSAPERQLPEMHPLTAEELAAAEAWLARAEGLPPAVTRLIKVGLTCAIQLANPNVKIHAMALQVRRALGITPSTERSRKAGGPLDGLPKDGNKARMSPKERLEHQHSRLGSLSKWHGDIARRQRAQRKKVEKRLKNLETEEEVELTPEEDAAELARENAEFEERLHQGQRCDLDCAEPAETLMRSGVAVEHVEEVSCTVSVDELPRDSVVLKRFADTRERVDVKLAVSTLDISVEKVLIETSGGQQRLVSASVDDIGPPRMKVTWNFLVNLAMMTASQCIPFNRFAMMASTQRKRFTAGEIGRYFVFTAEQFLPIYLALGRNLSNADVLSGDDTPTRVLEVTRAQSSNVNPLPWQSYSTRAKARETAAMAPTPSMGVRLAREFGFSFPRKDGSGDKTAFNTTVLSGREDTHEPRSTIVFYRSHLGSLGNLLDVVLAHRDHNNRKLVIQSDLSTTNLISNPELAQRLDVTLAGCASHARRPFSLHADAEPEFCEWILHSFKGLAIYEKSLSFHGRNRDNTLAIRGVDGLNMWEMIQGTCKLLLPRWSAKTPLGDGARYVLRHYDKLTYYLGDPRLAPSNNFAERMLRIEKLIQNNALFRQTLNGRFALDIMRTVLQTATAAGVDPQVYLLWVLRAPPDVVAREPQQFTPLAFARCCMQPTNGFAYPALATA